MLFDSSRTCCEERGTLGESGAQTKPLCGSASGTSLRKANLRRPIEWQESRQKDKNVAEDVMDKVEEHQERFREKIHPVTDYMFKD